MGAAGGWVLAAGGWVLAAAGGARVTAASRQTAQGRAQGQAFHEVKWRRSVQLQLLSKPYSPEGEWNRLRMKLGRPPAKQEQPWEGDWGEFWGKKRG